MNYKHEPVLVREVIDYLSPVSGHRYLDGTAGGGGYAEAILKASAPGGKVVCVDVDGAAVTAVQDRLAVFGERVIVERMNYAELEAGSFGSPFDGVVLDLGISSHQIDETGRGFSFLGEAPLDMRMDDRHDVTAFDIINGYSERELKEIFETYGEERFSGRISRAIVKRRAQERIETTRQLADICRSAYPSGFWKIHPATRAFQAIRIVVNGELSNLKVFLDRMPALLNVSGRAVIVSYHSLEDRLVKRRFAELSRDANFELLTKKPVVPTEEEIRGNPKSRSAKLRAITRIF